MLAARDGYDSWSCATLDVMRVCEDEEIMTEAPCSMDASVTA